MLSTNHLRLYIYTCICLEMYVDLGLVKRCYYSKYFIKIEGNFSYDQDWLCKVTWTSYYCT